MWRRLFDFYLSLLQTSLIFYGFGYIRESVGNLDFLQFYKRLLVRLKIKTKKIAQAMSQELNLDVRNSLEITYNAFQQYHIKIIKPVSSKQFLLFIDAFYEQEIKLNQSKDSISKTDAIWVHLGHLNLHFVGELCERGYHIHKGKGKNISLYNWMTKKQCLIPPFSQFYMGCGAVVIKDQCIFLVQEKRGDRKDCWNIPNGRANPNQTIPQCVERQLREQTNIHAKFKYILAFREAQSHYNGCLDIYFPCLMELNQNSLENLKVCETQIRSYKWVPLKDYYEFMRSKKDSELTQLKIAQYISRLWNQDFNFDDNLPNITKSKKIVKGETQIRSVVHELVRE